MKTPNLPVYLLGMSGVQSNRTKFLKYRHLHEELKSILEDMGWPVSNDGQLFAFAGLLQQQTPKAEPPPAKKRIPPATVGRREVARGDRPHIKAAIALVMADQVMTAGEVVAALKEKDWLPNTAPEKTQQYISYVLSSTPLVFERVERGKYKAIPRAVRRINRTLKKQGTQKAPKRKSTRARGSS